MERGDSEATQGGLNVETKTWVVNMADGFDFRGFHIQWPPQTRDEYLARIYLHRRPAVVEGEDSCPDG